MFSDYTDLEKAIHVPLHYSAIIWTCEKQVSFEYHACYRVGMAYHLRYFLKQETSSYAIDLDFDVISSDKNVPFLAIIGYIYIEN